jgi:hypothetical protein
MLPGSFRDPLFKVFFDVKTTYEILKTRESCVEKNKNYAKEKTLDQFNKMVALFSNKTSQRKLQFSRPAKKLGQFSAQREALRWHLAIFMLG